MPIRDIQTLAGNASTSANIEVSLNSTTFASFVRTAAQQDLHCFTVMGH